MALRVTDDNLTHFVGLSAFADEDQKILPLYLCGCFDCWLKPCWSFWRIQRNDSWDCYRINQFQWSCLESVSMAGLTNCSNWTDLTDSDSSSSQMEWRVESRWDNSNHTSCSEHFEEDWEWYRVTAGDDVGTRDYCKDWRYQEQLSRKVSTHLNDSVGNTFLSRTCTSFSENTLPLAKAWRLSYKLAPIAAIMYTNNLITPIFIL